MVAVAAGDVEGWSYGDGERALYWTTVMDSGEVGEADDGEMEGREMIDFERLKEPFALEDLEWRVQTAGEKNGKIWARVLTYVTARAVMDRLDAVVGPENWQDAYREGPQGGVLAGIGIRIGDEWVWKWDGAENTDIEAVKGGLSNALKRVAVKWGIGRYLYGLGESFANVHDKGQYRATTKDKKPFRWDPPALPGWAVPAPAQRQTKPEPVRDESGAPESLLNEIAERMVDDLITDKERADLRKWLAAGVTEAQAVQALNTLNQRIADRTDAREAA